MDLRNIELVSLCDGNLNRNLFGTVILQWKIRIFYVIRDYIFVSPELGIIMLFEMMTNITIDVDP